MDKNIATLTKVLLLSITCESSPPVYCMGARYVMHSVRLGLSISRKGVPHLQESLNSSSKSLAFSYVEFSAVLRIKRSRGENVRSWTSKKKGALIGYAHFKHVMFKLNDELVPLHGCKLILRKIRLISTGTRY